MPNLSGQIRGVYYAGQDNANGVFTWDINAWSAVVPNIESAGAISLNASNYNAIYGRSNTVQPPALVLLPQIRY